MTVTLSVMVMVRVSSGAPGGCMKGLHGKSANEIRATLVKFAPAFSYSFSASVTEKCPLPEQLSLRKVPAARAESDNQPLAQAAPAHSTPRSTAPWLAWTPHDKPAALLSLTCA